MRAISTLLQRHRQFAPAPVVWVVTEYTQGGHSTHVGFRENLLQRPPRGNRPADPRFSREPHPEVLGALDYRLCRLERVRRVYFYRNHIQVEWAFQESVNREIADTIERQLTGDILSLLKTHFGWPADVDVKLYADFDKLPALSKTTGVKWEFPRYR